MSLFHRKQMPKTDEQLKEQVRRRQRAVAARLEALKAEVAVLTMTKDRRK